MGHDEDELAQTEKGNSESHEVVMEFSWAPETVPREVTGGDLDFSVELGDWRRSGVD